MLYLGKFQLLKSVKSVCFNPGFSFGDDALFRHRRFHHHRLSSQPSPSCHFPQQPLHPLWLSRRPECGLQGRNNRSVIKSKHFKNSLKSKVYVWYVRTLYCLLKDPVANLFLGQIHTFYDVWWLCADTSEIFFPSSRGKHRGCAITLNTLPSDRERKHRHHYRVLA